MSPTDSGLQIGTFIADSPLTMSRIAATSRFLNALGSRPWALALGWTITAAVACVPTNQAPQATPNGTLALNDLSSSASHDGPFRVVFAGPSGETTSDAQISVVFSRPLRALDLAGEEAPPPLELTPHVEGNFRWVGTNALLFVPRAGKLPQATQFQVKIPAKLRALDGSVLEQAQQFDFNTPRPSVVQTSPWIGQTGLTPDTSFELRFNQPVSPSTLTPHVKLLAVKNGKSRAIPFRLVAADNKDPSSVRLVPEAPLPAAHELNIELAETLRGREGTLNAGQVQSLRYQTYGALRVTGLECVNEPPQGACQPGGGAWLTFSNPVRFRDFKSALTITPALPLTWESWRDDDDTTTYIDLNAAFAPGTNYTVQIQDSLRDVYGQPLGSNFRQQLRFGDHAPRVEIGVNGDYFEVASRPKIPVVSINVPEYQLTTAPLSFELIREHLLESQKDSKKAFAKLLERTRARARVVRSTAAKNRPSEEKIDAAVQLEKSGGRGPLLIAASYSGRKEKEQSMRIVQVTDLAISAKLSRTGHSVVWVTELTSGKPVAGAEVQLVSLDSSVSTTSLSTNQDGLVRFSPGALGPNAQNQLDQFLVLVKKGSDWAYRQANDYLYSWRMNVPTDTFGAPQDLGLLFTERGIYRPGDTVRLKGILRREIEAGNEILAGKKYTLQLRSPQWDILQTHTITTNAFGTFSQELRIPGTASLGSYAISVKEIHDSSYDQAVTSFELAEYKPVEMEARVQSDQTSYLHSQTAQFEVSGDYLFGAPMSGAEVQYRATRIETNWTLPKAEGFVNDAALYDSAYPEKAPASGVIDSGEAKLNAKGRFERKLNLNLPGQRGPELVSFDAEVIDVSRQTVASSSSRIVHPASFYVAVETPTPYFTTLPGSVEPKVIAATPEGTRLAGKNVRLELIQRKWTLARETSGGHARSELHPVDEIVASCTTKTTATTSSCALTPPRAGYYLILASAQDEKGRTVKAAVDTYALGAGESYWRDDDTLQVELVRDKNQYKPGETARILVKSPFKTADALVTIEGDGVRQERRVRLEGATPTITVPITEELRPNVYVAVHLVQPRSTPLPDEGRPDLGAPNYRIGHTELLIDPEARRLKIALDPNKTNYAPGESVELALQVADARGKGAASEVTVYVVDEGVLSLTGYRTPDPLPVFTASRPLRTATIESRDSMARVSLDLAQILGLGPNKGAEGGGGGDGESGARRDFRQSAYFNPTVPTDASGKAKLQFKLPESLTTFRIMAVATTTNDRYGYSEQRVTTSKKLMARPALPRLLRAGDRAEAGIIVSAKDFGPAEVLVQLDASGLKLNGPSSQKIQLDKNGSTEVRFALSAEQVGTARLRFSVEPTSGDKSVRDSVEVERRVISPASFETVALYGETTEASAEQLGDLSAIRKDTGELKLQAASTALVGLDGAFEQLLDYPYACTEQLASKLLPLLPLRALAKKYNIPLAQNPDAFIEKTLAEILTRQKYDGGFGMWPGSAQSSAWVSPYTLLALHEAQLHGYKLPEHTLEKARQFLRSELTRDFNDVSRASAALHVDVLALTGAPDPGYMNTLFQERKDLPVFAKALLLHAMAVSKQPAEDQATLVRELENVLHIEGNRVQLSENNQDRYSVFMDSPLRTQALILRALLRAQPKHPLASALVRGLLNARDRGAWRSTQETAFALLALNDYQAAQEQIEPKFTARFWQNDTTLFEGSFAGHQTNILEKILPTSNLTTGPLVFEKKGSGTLFYEARLRYARRELPKDSLDRGFYVHKTIRPVRPEELSSLTHPLDAVSQKTLPAGSLVLVDLIVVTPGTRRYAVIEDPLPAGLEAVDAQLSTSAAWTSQLSSAESSGTDPEKYPGHRLAFSTREDRKELRDDRVLFFIDHLPAGMHHYRYLARSTTFGRFVLPPTRAEEMYAPEIFGRTAAQVIEVK